MSLRGVVLFRDVATPKPTKQYENLPGPSRRNTSLPQNQKTDFGGGKTRLTSFYRQHQIVRILRQDLKPSLRVRPDCILDPYTHPPFGIV